MDNYEQIEVTDLDDLPEDIKEYVDADAEVLLEKCIPEDCRSLPEWKRLIMCMALHKHQLEVANMRVDELTQGVRQLAHTVVSFGSDFKKLCVELKKWQDNMGDDDDDNWWKRG